MHKINPSFGLLNSTVLIKSSSFPSLSLILLLRLLLSLLLPSPPLPSSSLIFWHPSLDIQYRFLLSFSNHRCLKHEGISASVVVEVFHTSIFRSIPPVNDSLRSSVVWCSHCISHPVPFLMGYEFDYGFYSKYCHPYSITDSLSIMLSNPRYPLLSLIRIINILLSIAVCALRNWFLNERYRLYSITEHHQNAGVNEFRSLLPCTFSLNSLCESFLNTITYYLRVTFSSI